MVSAECSKIFDGQCMGGGIFVSLEKIFVFNYSQTIFIQFYVKYKQKKGHKSLLAAFFGALKLSKQYQNIYTLTKKYIHPGVPINIYIYIYIYIYILYICYIYILYIYTYIKHGVLPHELWEFIWFSIFFLRRVGFFHFKAGGDQIGIWGDLEGYTALKIEFYTCSFIFSFLQDCVVV